MRFSPTVFLSETSKAKMGDITLLSQYYGEGVLIESQSLVGQFIEAVGNDRDEARRLLQSHPTLFTTPLDLGQNALHFLTLEGSPEDVEFLLQQGFDPERRNDFGDTPLLDACVLEKTETAKVLLAYGADPNVGSEVRFNAIHCCVYDGNAELIDALILAGAIPVYTTPLGETIFDQWPDCPKRQQAMQDLIQRHQIERPESE